jgi:hypothetical protein
MEKEDFNKLKIYDKWELVYELLIKQVNSIKNTNSEEALVKRINALEDRLNQVIKDINKALDRRGFK